jgi:hypothetical protein
MDMVKSLISNSPECTGCHSFKKAALKLQVAFKKKVGKEKMQRTI